MTARQAHCSSCAQSAQNSGQALAVPLYVANCLLAIGPAHLRLGEPQTCA